jgi:hypothetical protein
MKPKHLFCKFYWLNSTLDVVHYGPLSYYTNKRGRTRQIDRRVWYRRVFGCLFRRMR